MNEYIISCNIKKFDLVKHFQNSKTVIWKQHKSCKVGDYVYIYVGRPYSRLFYGCRVTQVDIKECPTESNFDTAKLRYNENTSFMELTIDEILPKDGLTLCELQNNGLKTVQCSTQVSDELHDYIMLKTRR